MLKKKSKSSGGGSKGGGSGFKYRERTSEDVKKRAEQQGGQFDSIVKSGIDRWRPKDGENAIRILPPTWGDHDHYGFDIWLHSFVGADKSTYLCPQKMNNEPCPICKLEREAKAAGEDDEAKQLRASRRVAVWILDRDEDNPTPALWDMSWSMDKDIAALSQNKRTGKVLLIDHPDEGYDITFNRTGKGLNTRYVGLAVDRDPSPISDDEDEQERIKDYIQENPIPDVLNFYDADYLDKMINAEVPDRDEDLDEDEDAPRGKKRGKDKAPARKARRDDSDEEDEDRPRGRGKPDRKASRRRDEEEEDDEEEVVEDDEEEEVVEDDEPEDRGRRASSRRDARRSRARDEDEEDDVGGGADEGGDEEEDAPPPRRTSSRRRDEPDEEEDGVEEDDDDPVDEEDGDEPEDRGRGRRPAPRRPERSSSKGRSR